MHNVASNATKILSDVKLTTLKQKCDEDFKHGDTWKLENRAGVGIYVTFDFGCKCSTEKFLSIKQKNF